MIISFDVGGIFVKYGLFDMDGTIVQQGKQPTEIETEEAFFALIEGVISSYEKEYSIKGIGFSFPGVIDSENGIPIVSGAIKPLRGRPFVQLLKERTGDNYPIFIENDGNCAALAELHSGNGQNLKDFVVLTLGTGIGGGIIHNHSLMKGGRYSAGEFGMMLIPDRQGKKVILAKYASTQGLLNLYRQRLGITSDTPVTGEEIFKGNTFVKKDVLNLWGEYVAMVIYNIIVSINPEKVLIGGGVSQNPLLLSLIEKPLKKFPEWALFETPIIRCYHQNDAGLIGAFYLVKKNL
ncbi:ROK family protein [Enterococcus sp. BWR-S5]|uniref:ROK family protein n=1 Tax=Enterococcus sp. BWR-S5 TaxID=2787714 RepID=UPI001924BE1F|nr:ROK family protein [Enterococcus sp. BWR-S5]MBL1225536.1 ROK family protein [Enterococcus sp. BWR-S5]